jgi:hypothetical protein
MDDPDVVLTVDRDAGDLAEDPVVRERLRPERFGLEFRHRLIGGNRGRNGGGDQRKRQGTSTYHDSLPAAAPVSRGDLRLCRRY